MRIKSRHRRLVRLAAGLAAVLMGMSGPAHAAAPDSKPYDEKLMRLAEILGAVHYLRELCSANEGLLWRDRMKELLDAEGTSALRRARLTRSFNQGYRSYSRTYVNCTPSAQTTISRFLTEGLQISEGLVKSVP
ncbi:MAG TPA: TIGR02301 family protein [Hyphomicrobiaceae bacterium]|nr:TIGR02301 family protein [Hyphomicrobiaceae bacterium]